MHFLDIIQSFHKFQASKAGGDAICLVVFISKHVFQENSRSAITECVTPSLAHVPLFRSIWIVRGLHMYMIQLFNQVK